MFMKISLPVAMLSLFVAGKACAATVPVELYVMSQCPYGVSAENALFPALESLKGSAELKFFFIAAESTAPAKGIARFDSMHGPREVEEDIRQLCVRSKYPEKFFRYVMERNAAMRKNGAWEEAAAAAGVPAEALSSCTGGDEGAALMSANIKVQRQPRPDASPTMYISGRQYAGARSQRAFTLAICGEISGKKPKACSDALALPPDTPAADGNCDNASAGQVPAVSFDYFAVAESSSGLCSPSMLEGLRTLHPNARFSFIRADSPEGKRLISLSGQSALPVYAASADMEKDASLSQILARFYDRKGGFYFLRGGPDTFVPCYDSTRERQKGQLDLAVEPLSPVAASAEKLVLDILSSSRRDDVNFSLRFILQEGVSPAEAVKSDGVRKASLKELSASASKGMLVSNGGADEVTEAKWQACLFQHAPVVDFFKYLECRNQNQADSSRRAACLRPTKALEECAHGPEGEKLLRSSLAFSSEFGIPAGSGAVLVWENRFGPLPVTSDKLNAILDDR